MHIPPYHPGLPLESPHRHAVSLRFASSWNDTKETEKRGEVHLVSSLLLPFWGGREWINFIDMELFVFP